MKEDKTESGPKITRTRKRLYDPLPAGETDAVPRPLTGSSPVSVPEPKPGPEPEPGSSGISTAEAETPFLSREPEADKIIKEYSRWSAGTVLIPVPLLDIAVVAGIQVMMVKKLCELYGLEYSKERVKAVLAAVVGGGHAGLIAGSLFKTVPLIGAAGAVASSLVVSGAITYAVGKVFVQHFETGGTLLNFNAAAVKAYYETKLKEGRKAVSEPDRIRD